MSSRCPGPSAVLVPLCLLAPVAWADDPAAPSLPPVVVVEKNPDASTLTQPDLPTARRQLATVPGGAEAVDADAYAGGRVSNLTDVLGGATGVYVQPRFGAEESRLS